MASYGLQQLERRMERNPASLVFARLADGYRKRGDIDEAINICKSGLSRHASHITGRLILGRCYLEKEKFKEAAQEFASVCVMDRYNVVALKMLADIFVRQGMREKAGDLYSYLGQIDPENESLRHLVAQFPGRRGVDLFEILGNYPQMLSATVLTEATREVPKHVEDSPPTEAFSALGVAVETADRGGEVVELGGMTDAATSIEKLSPAAAGQAGPSGDDVSKRIEFMFEGTMEEPQSMQREAVVSPDEAAELAASLPAQDEPLSLDEIQNAQTMAVSAQLLREAADETAHASEIAQSAVGGPGELPLSSAGTGPSGMQALAARGDAQEHAGAIEMLETGEALMAQPTAHHDYPSSILEELQVPDEEAILNAETMAVSGAVVRDALGDLPISDDIAARMEELFAATSDEASVGGAVSQRESPLLSAAVDVEAAAGPAVDEELPIALQELGEEGEISGDDVGARIEALFGSEELAAEQAAEEAPLRQDAFSFVMKPETVVEAETAVSEDLQERRLQLQTLDVEVKSSARDHTEDTAAAFEVPENITDTQVRAGEIGVDAGEQAQEVGQIAPSGDDVRARLDMLFGDEGQAMLEVEQKEGETDLFDMTGLSDETIMTPADGTLSMVDAKDRLGDETSGNHDTAIIEAALSEAHDDTFVDGGVEAVADGDIYVLSEEASESEKEAAYMEMAIAPEGDQRDNRDALVKKHDELVDIEQTRASIAIEEIVQDETVMHESGLGDVEGQQTFPTAAEDGPKGVVPIDESVGFDIDKKELSTPQGSDIAERLDEIFGKETPVEGAFRPEEAELPAEEGIEIMDRAGRAQGADVEAAVPLPVEGEAGVEETVTHAAELEALQEDTVFHSEDTEETIAFMPAERHKEGRGELDETVAEEESSPARSGDDSSEAAAIPDHVLTPTLADIYYQQGQVQMAIQIYERLLQKDSENERIRKRLEEIRNAQAQGIVVSSPVPSSPPGVEASVSASAADSARPAGRSGVRRKRGSRSRSLEGVHIQKRVKERLKKSRRKPPS